MSLVNSAKELSLKALKNTCNYLGNGNDAVYAVAVIAIFKGIFRPLFTLTDKKEAKENRNYAALREGLTEVIALTSYPLVSGLIKKTFAEKVAKSAEGMKGELKHAVNPENIKKVISFLGVCLTATIIIPYLCNLILPPVMNKLKQHRELKNKQLESINNIDIKQTPVVKPSEIVYKKNPLVDNYFKTRTNIGMRVGN